MEAANAGPGNLEVIVNNGKVPSTPKALGSSLYAITFVPKDTEDHQIQIKFNGEAVPGKEGLRSPTETDICLSFLTGITRRLAIHLFCIGCLQSDDKQRWIG